MKAIRRIAIIGMTAMLAVVSVTAPTFSWYTHSGSENGSSMQYAQTGLPISTKTLSEDNIVYSTVKCDLNGVVTDTTPVNRINLAPDAQTPGKTVQYYKTTFTNNGATDVYVDFEASKLANSADYVIGTLSPTINEKAFASRASRVKVSGEKTRVYFRTHNTHKDYWGNYVSGPVTDFGTGLTNDFNIAYKTSTADDEQFAKLNICSTSYDEQENYTHNSSNPANSVFWYDLPNNTEYFYFFNHWYCKSTSNREWNRTLDITNLSPGNIYYLTGGKVDGKWKEYAVESSTELLAINQSYSSVRMSNGNSVYADIGLKKVNEEDPEFIPEYYGAKIEYSITSGSGVISVNMDGLITPHATGSGQVTTTVTGKYGDSDAVVTEVTIPSSIDQVPIIRNVKVPAAGSTDSDGNEISNTVEILWYALNKSTSPTDIMTTGDNNDQTPSLYYTL